jgi:hypothetical protein
VDVLGQRLLEIETSLFHEKRMHDIWSGFPELPHRQLLDQSVLGDVLDAVGSAAGCSSLRKRRCRSTELGRRELRVAGAESGVEGRPSIIGVGAGGKGTVSAKK